MKPVILYTPIDRNSKQWEESEFIHESLSSMYDGLGILRYKREVCLTHNTYAKSNDYHKAIQLCLKDIKFLLRKQYHLYAHYWD